MFSVFVVPTALASLEYSALTPVEEIRPLRLLTVEEKLDELMKSMSKIMTDIRRNITGNSMSSVEDKISKYTWNSSSFPMANFQALLGHVEGQIFDLQKSLVDQVYKINEARVKMAKSAKDLEGMVEMEQFMFIGCLYCLVDWSSRKRFEKFFDPKVLFFIRKLEGRAVYKVYCLKNDIEDVKKNVCDVLEKSVEFVNSHLIDMPSEIQNKQDGASDDASMKALGESFVLLFDQCLELLLFTTVLRGFVESLNKYGLPPDFKYKIVRRECVEKEVKRLKKKSKEKNIHDIIAIVDIPLNM